MKRQTPETVVILIRVSLLTATAAADATAAASTSPAPPSSFLLLLLLILVFLVLDLGAVEDVDGVGRQRELQAAQVLVHHLFTVDELCTVDLRERRTRSVKTENQSGVSASSSKVMMAKANVEPLNCQSWWQAIQCCTCLVHSAAWKPGGVF
ncbi:hypothetical protein INR49_005940 [Caranx melampygus]|nr:hypothetical protein INR49_005940 [Caranx melampygus]